MIRKIILILLLLPILGWSQQKYWIFFTDKRLKGIEKNEATKKEKDCLLQKTLDRRTKVLSEQNLIDETDLPVNTSYLNEIKLQGIDLIIVSRWLNAASVRIRKNQLKTILTLTFVKNIRPVSKFKIKLPRETAETLLTKPQTHQFDYGASLQQNEMMRVPDVHDLGLDGSGVLVGMLDTGFNYKFHDAFQHLKVLGEYDVINQDSVTSNEEGDPSSQQSHGTITLSTIAGFKEGELIGPAFGASFLLAKTEVTSSETIVEEDYWVAGLEWMERQGVDVVSSSLGYNDWYEYADMDGETAITTLAANIAAKKGVVVVNSMGNEGNNPWYYMIAPADGFNVISVGAVYSGGSIVEFSSRGPTYDGRIKPDVVAMGKSVACVSVGSIDQYRTASGTSLSCPLVAGVAVLVLQAHPYLTPDQVRSALRETANNALMPDNDYGWGLVNAYEAIFYHGLFFSALPEILSSEQMGHLVKIKIYSKYTFISDSLLVYYAIGEENFSSVKLFPSGVEYEYQAWLPLQPKGTEIKLYFSAADKSGNFKLFPHKAPKYYFSCLAFDTSGTINGPLPSNFRLYQNYPNPFMDITTIEYDVFDPEEVSIIIYNIRGQQIKTLINKYHPRKHYDDLFWDGQDNRGQQVAAGIYFYLLKSGSTSIVKRLVFLGKEKSR